LGSFARMFLATWIRQRCRRAPPMVRSTAPISPAAPSLTTNRGVVPDTSLPQFNASWDNWTVGDIRELLSATMYYGTNTLGELMRNANGEGSIHPWRRDGKQNGYRGMITYEDDRGEVKRFAVWPDASGGPRQAGCRARAAGRRRTREGRRTPGGGLAVALAFNDSGGVGSQRIDPRAVRDPVRQTS